MLREQGFPRNHWYGKERASAHRNDIYAATQTTLELYPFGKKTEKKLASNNFILHLHPPVIAVQALNFFRTWGLGGMSLVLFLLMVITGSLLLSVYDPDPAKAHNSVLALQQEVLFGKFIQNIHYWGANALAIISFFHLLRVFFTGGFDASRLSNWMIGIFLFSLIIAANITGHLLPWDQFACWAVAVYTGMFEYLPGIGEYARMLVFGGDKVAFPELSFFFTCHVLIIPLAFFLVTPFHIWLVRMSGGIVLPIDCNGNEKMKVSVVPNLVLKELVVALVLIACIFISALFDAPIHSKAVKSPRFDIGAKLWYFAGLQEMLLYIHPFFSIWIFPGLFVGFLFAIPYKEIEPEKVGIWFRSRKGRYLAVLAAVAGGVVVFFFYIVLSVLGGIFSNSAVYAPKIIKTGLMPFSLFLIAVGSFCYIAKKQFAASRSEIIQGVFILLLTCYGMTVLKALLF